MKSPSEQDLEAQRFAMVEQQLRQRGIDDMAILRAMSEVPRHEFLPEELRDRAYFDEAIGLAPAQSISQPFVVAMMLQEARIKSGDTVLEIGTGTGYQAAILSKIARRVFTIELDPVMSRSSAAKLREMKHDNVVTRCANGAFGWPEEAPFDAIIVAAAAESIPRDLVRQLKVGGRMVLPIGSDDQELVLLEKTQDGLKSTDLGAVRFVPIRENP